jgi:hypothetical protein
MYKIATSISIIIEFYILIQFDLLDMWHDKGNNGSKWNCVSKATYSELHGTIINSTN